MIVNISATTDDGEAIAYNTTDGLIYRLTGEDTLQSITPNTLATVNYAFSHTTADYGHALYYKATVNNLVLVAGDSIYTVSITGVLSDATYCDLGDNTNIKGLIVAPVPASVSTIKKFSLVSIYSNPSNGLITINSEEQIRAINIYSLKGKLIESTSIFFEKVITKNLQKGACLIEVLFENNTK